MIPGHSIDTLNSKVCHCGRPKVRHTPFCGVCYHALPQEIREGLWARIGRGFEAGYQAAIDWLKQKQHAD